MKNIRSVKKSGVTWYVLSDLRVELLGGAKTRRAGKRQEPRTSSAYINGVVKERFPKRWFAYTGGKPIIEGEAIRKGTIFVDAYVAEWLRRHAKTITGESVNDLVVAKREQGVRDRQTVQHIKDYLNVKESPKDIMRDLMSNMFEGHDVRTAIKDDGSVWFVLKDVCEVIGITNHKDVSSRLDSVQKSGVGVADPHGRVQETTIVSEDGLYDVILTSNKPKSRDLLKWVTKEVLPSIRNTGGYGEVSTIKVPDTLAGALRLAADQAEATERALGQARAALQLVEEAKPKVDYYDKVLASEETFDATMIAKELGYRSAQALNLALHELGVQFHTGYKWELYADYCGKGYTENRTEEFGGKMRNRMVWTQKGRKMIHDLIARIVPFAK